MVNDNESVGCILFEMCEIIFGKFEVIESEEGVVLLFVIESGSCVWGFFFLDSDYDVCFVYVWLVDWYLFFELGWDVIELFLEGDLDINGWDIKKMFSLLFKFNLVVLEWLFSLI